MARAARTHTAKCVDCGGEVTSSRPIPAAGLSCGRGSCLDTHNARAVQWERGARERRAERARWRGTSPRQPVRLFGDLAAVAAFNGLDAYGRPVP